VGKNISLTERCDGHSTVTVITVSYQASPASLCLHPSPTMTIVAYAHRPKRARRRKAQAAAR
jgi:hypothetical protein